MSDGHDPTTATHHELSVFADYFQIQIFDPAKPVDLSGAWDETAASRMLAVAPYVVGVGTARNMAVPLMIDVEQSDPGVDPAEWDNVVEGDLLCESGRLVVMGPTDYLPDAYGFAVSPGHYRVRACARGLATLSPNGLEGDDEYHVVLWPSDQIGIRLVKQARS